MTTGQYDLRMCNQLNGQPDQNTADEKTVATDTSLHHALGLDRNGSKDANDRRDGLAVGDILAPFALARVITR